ncbi:hypothetical protein KFK09_015314 [Dendrobium nobile]|uniref:Uncharacterized protein n=1 Tax=Dendrobium nobile TaxID=94219 RepID=A0A8T3B5M8_DENNO|nr:hypothetical protein KFK09_015314 [Dendrobium nobile]
MQGYTPKIHFRCRTSGFREVCDELAEKFGDQFVNSLSELQINQFLLLPRFPQNVPMVYILLSTWEIESESFVINSRSLAFTSEEIALIIGLPNRGDKFEPGTSTIAGRTANDIRHEILKLKSSTPIEIVREKFIVYLLSNIFFPMANFRVQSTILDVAKKVEQFRSYNWPLSIRDFLVNEFNTIAKKKSKGQSLGYVNGFVMIIIVSNSYTYYIFFFISLF